MTHAATTAPYPPVLPTTPAATLVPPAPNTTTAVVHGHVTTLPFTGVPLLPVLCALGILLLIIGGITYWAACWARDNADVDY